MLLKDRDCCQLISSRNLKERPKKRKKERKTTHVVGRARGAFSVPHRWHWLSTLVHSWPGLCSFLCPTHLFPRAPPYHVVTRVTQKQERPATGTFSDQEENKELLGSGHR